MVDYLNFKKQMEVEQKILKSCKTKEDLNNLWKDRIIIINDNSDWHGKRCTFIEMVGEGKRENWKMKVKTPYNTFLEVKANKVIIVAQTITTTEKESHKILSAIKKSFE